MTETNLAESYDVVLVGGGPAGLTSALYTTRLGHDTAVIDRGGGRAAMMLDTHNVVGVTEEVSGNAFLSTAVEQIESGTVTGVERVTRSAAATDEGEGENGDGEGNDPLFRVESTAGEVTARRVVLSTGFTDVRPDPPLPRTGRGLHWCLHCDAYMFVDEPVYVMGHSDAVAHVTMIMLNFTSEVDLLLNGDEPTWSDETAELLDAHPVDVVETEVTGKYSDPDDSEWLGGFEFADGTERDYRGGFAMYGSDYNNDLAAALGCELNDDGTVAVDDHGHTSVDGVYAVGDLTRGHNQIPVAMGEGAKTGIDLHMSLRAFPRSQEEIHKKGPVDTAETPAISDRLRERAGSHEVAEVEAPADD
ncbi:thioredoxin-disulfide reductase [Halobacteriales archaeon SW_7_71_33]|nr:MAG: thioredoxin-disulfide reductase [Halobacteriales archaeon SW_7_71_33]